MNNTYQVKSVVSNEIKHKHEDAALLLLYSEDLEDDLRYK